MLARGMRAAVRRRRRRRGRAAPASPARAASSTSPRPATACKATCPSSWPHAIADFVDDGDRSDVERVSTSSDRPERPAWPERLNVTSSRRAAAIARRHRCRAGTQRRGGRRRPRRTARHRSGDRLPVAAAAPPGFTIGDLDAALYERRSLDPPAGNAPDDVRRSPRPRRRRRRRRARRRSSPRSAGARCSSWRRRASTSGEALVERRLRRHAGAAARGRATPGAGAHADRHPVAAAGAARRGQAVRGAGLDHQPDPPAAVDRRAHRAHPPARFVAVEPVPLDSDRSVVRRAAGREIPAAAARTELVRRWLRTYGPGTTNDIAWWAKWTKKQVVDALGELGAVAVTVEPAPGAPPAPAWVLARRPRRRRRRRRTGPVVSLLPSLDPAIMGWKEREWILDGLGPQLFDRNGNAGPIDPRRRRRCRARGRRSTAAASSPS